jgi:PAS domain S-box-containing protein
MKHVLAILSRLGRLNNLLAVVLAVLLPVVVTVTAWRTALGDANREARVRFEFQASQMTQMIEDRMQSYEQALHGARGLFAAAKSLDRDEWRAYVENLKISTLYPGMQGIGYAKRIRPQEKAAFIESAREEGISGYTIRPEGARAEYAAVIYIEPFSDRNLRALGYDMYSNPVRRAAMDRARDTGETAISGKIIPVQESGKNVQAGFLMYVPIYQKGRELMTVESRRGALLGYVYGIFRMNDLIRGVLGPDQKIALTVRDDADSGKAALLYDGTQVARAGLQSTEPMFTTTANIPFHGRLWTLRMDSLPQFEATIDRDKPRLVLFGGIAIDLLFFTVIWSLWTTRSRALTLARDMTSEVRARQAETQAMNDASPLGIFRTDASGRCVYVNRMYEAISGVAAADAAGGGWAASIHPVDRDQVMNEWESATRAGKPYAGAYRFLRPDGSVIWASVKAAAIREGGRLLGYTGSVEDITERRQNMEALNESRERLDLALEGSDLALFDWDLATGVVHLSGRWQEILGGDDRPTVTTFTELQALVHPEDMPVVQKKLYAVLKGQATFYQVEHRVRNRRGEWQWILSRAKVVERDGTGHAVRVAGTNADITARKEIERLKNEFMATVSHELRTPLTAIIGALGLMKESSAKMPEDAAMFLDMACQNSERLAMLINDVLDLEKIESGQLQFHIEPLDIPAFLEKAVNVNTAYADKYGVRFQLLRPVPQVQVQADAGRLLQVITNLMSNAAKFSPAGGTIDIAAEMRGLALRVSVRDRGPGIPPEFRDRIFGRFAQADSSDSRQKGGTGLGLSISKAIVEKMGGRVGFDSAPGEGATFYFELPAGAEHGSKL